MDWLKNLFGKQNKQGKPNDQVFVGDQIPVNQSLEFRSHNQFVTEYFSFLVDEYGFYKPTSYWHSREYHTQYKNNEVEIRIVFETSSLPWVSIRKGTPEMPKDAYHNLAELGTGDSFQRLFAKRSSRHEPKVKKFVDKAIKENIYDSRELDNDYRRWGRAEHEAILFEYATLIKQHPEILSGNFSVFTPDVSPGEKAVGT